MRFFYALLFISVLGNSANAQLNYAFSALQGTYTSIAGTSPSLTVTTTDGGSGADEAYAIIPIGFTFNYNGKDYLNVGITTNGYAYFGTGTPTVGGMFFNGLKNGETAIRPIIAPLWDDLDMALASNVTYETSGSAPDRILTIQWSDAEWSFSATASVISFQLKLFENQNIQFIYNNEAAASFNASASIGITDSAKGAGNFISLQNTSSLPTISSTTETTSLNTEPASGQIYQFTRSTTLPVALTYFKGTRTESSNLLNWSTAGETNNKGFSIERSGDGQVFTTLTFIKTKATGGNSSAALSYDYADKSQDDTYYYRLKQVSADGKFFYSKVIKIVSETLLPASLSLYPNPAANSMQCFINAHNEGDMQLVIKDMNGRCRWQQSVKVGKGKNRFSFDIMKLPAGLYCISANGIANEVMTAQFVKE